MKITEIIAGISTPHEKGHALNWPNGTEYWLIMGFQSPYTILGVDGNLHKGNPGDYIIQPPHTPLYHSDTGDGNDGFKNDWIIIYGDGIGEMISSLELPVNKIFSLSDHHFLRHHLKKILSEKTTRPPYYELRCEAIISEMLILLKRAYDGISIKGKESFERISASREQMLQSYDKSWSLEAVAKLAELSPSRFIELYRRYYGVSPINDLIFRRIEAAKELMVTTQNKLETIALMCGFSSINYFSNCFKKHEGISPAKWRDGHK